MLRSMHVTLNLSGDSKSSQQPRIVITDGLSLPDDVVLRVEDLNIRLIGIVSRNMYAQSFQHHHFRLSWFEYKRSSYSILKSIVHDSQ